MNKILNQMKTWINEKYEGIIKSKYTSKIYETMGLIQDNSRITADIYEHKLRRGGQNFVIIKSKII